MATSLQNLTTSPSHKPSNMVMLPFEYDERRFEKEAAQGYYPKMEKRLSSEPKPIAPRGSIGEFNISRFQENPSANRLKEIAANKISEVTSVIFSDSAIEQASEAFKTTKELATDVADAGLDLLLKKFLGIGENSPKPNTSEEDLKKKEDVARQKDFFAEVAKGSKHEVKNVQVSDQIVSKEQLNYILGLTNSYEGTTDDKGQVRADVIVIYERKNSEMQEEEIKKQKEVQMAKATGNKSLINDLNAQEGQSLVSSSGAIAGAG